MFVMKISETVALQNVDCLLPVFAKTSNTNLYFYIFKNINDNFIAAYHSGMNVLHS